MTLGLEALPGPEGLTPELALWLLRSAPRSESALVALLVQLCQAHPQPSRALANALLTHLEALGTEACHTALALLASRSEALAGNAMGQLLLAQGAEALGDLAGAAQHFRQADRPGVAAQDSVLLDLTRVLWRQGALAEAVAVLRLAAGALGDFAGLTRAAKLLGRLQDPAAQACATTLRVAILSPHTTDLWLPLLRLGLFREGLWAQFWVPPYGAYQQVVLDPASGLYGFAPELVVLANTWQELDLPAFSPDPDRVVAERVAEVVGRWQALQARLPVRIIQYNFEVPAVDPNGQLGHILPEGRAVILRRINERLVEEARRHQVTLLNLDHLAACYGKRAWSDAATWFSARQYPAPAALPALVAGQVTRILAGLGRSKKVLVLDLDNTLWGGVVGEDGLHGLQIGPPTAAGEAHLALQRYAAQLKARGILLAVCSKNLEAVAKSPFLEHPGMHLRLDDFVGFLANWQDKASNLRSLAQSLNLGLDSFVFLDDNPVERALVRQALPQVTVPELGSDPARYVEILDATACFDADGLSQEDLARTRHYLSNQERAAARNSAGSLDDFLAGLEMVCEHGPVTEPVLGRVLQLLGKTNQFNLTTRRHGEAELRAILADPRAWTQYYRLRDRYDDNGLVALLIAVPMPGDPAAWLVDTWLMSCRVIGRQLERVMFETLMAAARARAIVAVHGLYVPTAKNGLVAGLYQELGFTEGARTEAAGLPFWIAPALVTARPVACITCQALPALVPGVPHE